MKKIKISGYGAGDYRMGSDHVAHRWEGQDEWHFHLSLEEFVGCLGFNGVVAEVIDVPDILHDDPVISRSDLLSIAEGNLKTQIEQNHLLLAANRDLREKLAFVLGLDNLDDWVSRPPIPAPPQLEIPLQSVLREYHRSRAPGQDWSDSSELYAELSGVVASLLQFMTTLVPASASSPSSSNSQFGRPFYSCARPNCNNQIREGVYCSPGCEEAHRASVLGWEGLLGAAADQGTSGVLGQDGGPQSAR